MYKNALYMVMIAWGYLNLVLIRAIVFYWIDKNGME